MQVQVKYLQNNRERIFEQIKDNSFVIIHSGAAPFKSVDASYPFFVNRNFFYLTGINQEDVTLVIGKLNGVKKELLFIDENDPTNYETYMEGYFDVYGDDEEALYRYQAYSRTTDDLTKFVAWFKMIFAIIKNMEDIEDLDYIYFSKDSC